MLFIGAKKRPRPQVGLDFTAYGGLNAALIQVVGTVLEEVKNP